jgi:hypothetical protein
MIMDLEVICIIECDDCGKSVIIDPTYVTIITGDFITAAAVCSHCERPVVEEIDSSLARNMAMKGVRTLSWISGEEVDPDDIKC